MRASAHAAISAQQLTRSFGQVQALRGIDLHVAQGELFGLVGPDGAGKTTAIMCLAGLLRPTSGSAQLLGHDPMARQARVRERLGLMPQQYSLYGDLTVAENLHFFGRLFGLSKPAHAQRVERLLSITRLARFTERRADALSGGMYKKLALACALLHTPRVLLMDEPTNGVDPVSRRELWELIYELLEEGLSVLVSTPYMDEAARCHRVALLHQGRIVAQGSPHELVQQMPYCVYELASSQSGPLQEAIARLPYVLAASPSGSRVRVIVAAEHVPSLNSAVAALPVEMRPVPANFEDLFLARTREEAA